VVNADLATANAQCCTPDKIGIRTYVLPDDGAACEIQVYVVSNSSMTGLLPDCPVLSQVDIFGQQGGTVCLTAQFVGL
jgi:hypothetical protein